VARTLEDTVVVVTGASSGIGRATTEALAAAGATVVATARRAEPLEELARTYDGHDGGGTVVPMPAEITDADAVDRIAAETMGRFGRLDGWVNNAAVEQYGRFEELPLDEWRRVVEVNLFGQVNGARAAIPYFREQGRGVLVNVASVLAKVAAPFQSAYVTSKFGIRGLSDALRSELDDVPDIDVCTILPGPIDTPLFQHAANRMGVVVKPPEPTIDADRVAAAIVRALRRPKREIAVGASTRLGLIGNRLAPGLTDRVNAAAMKQVHFAHDEPTPPTSGNVFEPVAFGTEVSGGWKPHRGGTSGRAVTLLGLGAAAAAVGAIVAVRTRRH
jgi:NAD(P)-dependent dehydrogenase (short-subunit alcohol dehydrogenase family)